MEYNLITEAKNLYNIKDFKVWIYELSVRDIKNRHIENFSLISKLKKINKTKEIVFFEYKVMSFEKINYWNDEKYISEEQREINENDKAECILLERLLLENLKQNIDTSKYIIGKLNTIFLKDAVMIKNNIELRRGIKFDININNEKNIIIGFDLSHGFEYVKTLEDDIKSNNIKPNDKVKDIYNNSYYTYIKEADFSISQKNEYMNTSIVDYYINKNLEYIVKDIDKNQRAVLVKTNQNDIFPYISNRLKRCCSFSNIQFNMFRDINQFIKLSAGKKITIILEMVLDIIKNNKYIKFNKHQMISQNLGYKVNKLNIPNLKFRNNTCKHIRHGISEGLIYDKDKIIEISYFIDIDLYNDMNKRDSIINITKELEDFSQKIGVKINRIKNNNFRYVRTSNKDLFEMDLKKISKEYKRPVVFIMSSKNIKQYYESVKNIFGNKENLPTQFINYETLNNYKNKENIFYNILLGIYAKCGVTSWILKEELSSDCYVGLDVSHDDGISSLGVVQIIGKEGKMLKNTSITHNQNGEKIGIDSIRNILQDVKITFENTYNKKLKTVVFHRDGISREELDILKECAKNLEIEISYIEVTKNINRRIAKFDKDISKIKEECWSCKTGTYYTKDDIAYLVSTSPNKIIGMAKPIRIRKIYSNQNIDKIVGDIYKLSFMHVGSTQQPRLPITTYYADLSSTYGNRRFMPSEFEGEFIHFV